MYYFGVFVLSLLFFYGYQFLEGSYTRLKFFQIIEFPVLSAIVIAIYLICSDKKVLNIYNNRIVHFTVYYISACCLEIYLSQYWSFGIGERLKALFPLNVIITFAVVFLVAYMVKVISNFLSQTFSGENYNWKKMVVS